MDMNDLPNVLFAKGTPPADVQAVLDDLLQDALGRLDDAPPSDGWGVLGAALLPTGPLPMMIVGWWRPDGVTHAHMLTLYMRPDSDDPTGETVNIHGELERLELPAHVRPGFHPNKKAPGFGPNDTFLG